ncbi:heterokaryon incompatibility protein-domain-containing protein [Hypoxylon trugodes]|uniref:heterokaryon incompatibility protein-domain-containing protein n=1 Tax=Hypoxylon trugodes TaxID=326681 RepID=UPI0021A184AC|nr:heterokaryon incompatibility protein-domain-containing protein [Hypoxylon trugodes]KAI1390059.1 heterokaryon incompatibility protein-domain-containing protein [Hypoxylon trugodes]
METDCSVCGSIWLGLATTELAEGINLGSFDEALSSPCSIHTTLVQQFKDYCEPKEGERTWRHPAADSKDVGIVPRSKTRSATIYPSLSSLGLFWHLLLVNRPSVPNHPGTGRILNPDWVDIDLLPRWKHECLTAHGAKCENPLKIWRTRPAWLIDVERKCLVPGDKCDGPFIALSYRYGEYPPVVIDATVLSTLQQPNALDTPQMSPYVLPIVRHAMYITSIMSERYLWVDSLCISHRDRKTTAQQLEHMAAIYGNAIVTIIAADTDSMEGLPGLKGVSESRKMEQRVVPLGEEQLVVRNTGIFSLTGGTPYYKRGWTFQEYTHSSRKVFFNQKELHWECSCSVWHEETTSGVEVDKYINPRMRTILAGFPDMDSLNHTISNYNERQLRYDEDALPAISGLLSVASRTFTGGFLYGLPEMLFETALGWRPYWGHTNLRRRAPSERSEDSRLNPSQLPSWSWVGWQGLLTAGYGEAARINTRQYYIQETFPITEWYTANSPTAAPSERRRINSTWYADRDSYKDLSKPLPPGWTRHEAPKGNDFIYPDGCGEFVFEHERMEDPDDETKPWYYPVPIPDISESTPPTIVEQTAYLFCETRRGRLWACRNEDPIEGGNILRLLDAENKQVGTLHSHNETQSAEFPDDVVDGEHHGEGPAGKEVELVAIYRYKKYSKTYNKETDGYGLPTATNKIAVLWLEWADGVAYRLASGQVDEEAWDKLSLEDVSLVIG